MHIFNGISYKTQAGAKKAIQDFINRVGICTIDETNTDDFQFFTDLVNNHERKEEKIGCGIKRFHIRNETNIYTSRTLCVEQIDGTVTSFSYKSCIGVKKYKLEHAFRSSITPFVREYKESNEKTCALCKKSNLFPSQYHTDHKTIPFSVIQKEFLKETILPVPTIFDKDPSFPCPIFFEKDKPFEDAWIQYHNERADYQILCATCNIKKSNK